MCPDWNRQRWLTPNAGWQQKIGRSGPAPKVKAALEILGCMGGKLEKETEARVLHDDRDDPRLSLTKACSAV